MKYLCLLALALGLVLCSACQPPDPLCTEEQISYRPRSDPFPEATPLPTDAEPVSMEINGKPMVFDQVVHGQLCNNHLSGTVYIACDVEIYEWQDASKFLDGCDFVVEDGTVIYAGAHNNAAYYKGCAECHQSDGQ